MSKQRPRPTDGTRKMDNKPDCSGNEEMMTFAIRAKTADDRMLELLFQHHRQRYGETRQLGTERPRQIIGVQYIRATSPLANF